MDVTDEDLSGIIDRAVGRWVRQSENVSFHSTPYGSEFRSAAMNLSHTGGAICDLLKSRKPLYVNDVEHLAGRWTERASTSRWCLISAGRSTNYALKAMTISWSRLPAIQNA